MNIQHSSRSDQWGTPVYVMRLVREVLGPIDLDPASSEAWNHTVHAHRYIAEDEDGLGTWSSDRPGPWSVYLNPPGGKLKNRSMAGMFWERLMQATADGQVRHAIFMAFSAEALQNTQSKSVLAIMDFPICVPAKRLQFVHPGVEAKSPSHSNVVVYVPGTENHTSKFMKTFSALGKCKR